MRLLSKDQLARAIVETVRQPLLLLDDGFIVVEANPAFYQHFRVSPAETTGEEIFALGNHQWNIGALRELLKRVIADDLAIEGYEVRHDFPFIGERVVIVNARQVVLDQQKQRLLLVTFEDVTARRHLESTASAYSRRLETINRELEEFAHAAAHDLQEPLRKIRVFADRFVRSFSAESLTAPQRDYLERITSAAARMQRRIDDVLKLARISRKAPSVSLVDLNAVLSRVLDDLSELIERAGAQVDADILPPIQANAAQMELVLQNLLVNALKFRRPDVAPRIRIGCELPSSDPTPVLRLVVSDNGVGFPPDKADRLFRPFERLHARDQFDGTGIGLSIVRRIVELHGGQVRASSAPGEGASFEVTLPLEPRMTDDREPESNAESSADHHH